MKKETKKQLIEWADHYETEAFITGDPIQFPHRFFHKQDIEIVSLLTAWISFGNRKMICQKAEELVSLLGKRPLEYVYSKKWETDFPANDNKSFYRTCPKKQMFWLFKKLYHVYEQHESLEEHLLSSIEGTPRERLCNWLGVSNKSPQKKLNMFLRWMVRKNSPVDFGLLTGMQARDLIIPLDTHVNRMAFELKMTDKETYSLQQALRITRSLNEVFPNDPCKGDFALFGYGVEHKQ